LIPIRDDNPSERPPVLTVLLIAANAAVFLFQWSLPEAEHQRFLYTYGLVPVIIGRPELARAEGLEPIGLTSFLTSMFLHGGFLHVLMNMWFLWLFGDNVEDRMGPWRFLVFYLLCGLLAGYTHYLTDPASALPTVGASGAVAGVMGAYAFMFPHARVLLVMPFVLLLAFEVPAITFLGLWFLLELWKGTRVLGQDPSQVGGIAFWAHVGGFAAGALLHVPFGGRRRRVRVEVRDRERDRRPPDRWPPSRPW